MLVLPFLILAVDVKLFSSDYDEEEDAGIGGAGTTVLVVSKEVHELWAMNGRRSGMEIVSGDGADMSR